MATVIARSTVTASHHDDDTVDSQQHQQHNSALSHSDWIREIVAVTHCLIRLQKLPQVRQIVLYYFYANLGKSIIY